MTEQLSLEEASLGELFRGIPPNILEMTNLGKQRLAIVVVLSFRFLTRSTHAVQQFNFRETGYFG
jgi:hypothetical protein